MIGSIACWIAQVFCEPIIRLSPDGKTYETVTDRYQGKRLNSPNDVVLGPDGAVSLPIRPPTCPRIKSRKFPLRASIALLPIASSNC